MGQIVEGENLPVEHYPDNVRVKELPQFFDLGTKLYQSFENSGRHLLQAIAIHLGIGEFYFNKHVYNGNSILRAIHYPPIINEPKSAVRAEQHEDINLISVARICIRSVLMLCFRDLKLGNFKRSNV